HRVLQIGFRGVAIRIEGEHRPGQSRVGMNLQGPSAVANPATNFLRAQLDGIFVQSNLLVSSLQYLSGFEYKLKVDPGILHPVSANFSNLEAERNLFRLRTRNLQIYKKRPVGQADAV